MLNPHAMHRADLPAGPFRVEKKALADAAEADDGERAIRFIASDESVDRFGDVINADGWQLKAFRDNPVLLWAHDHAAPIGTVEPIKVEGKRLMATARFAPAGDSPLADSLWALVRDKQLRAFSVGFTVNRDDVEPIRDQEENVTGYRFLKQELLEVSLVTVPANPNALSVARSLGIPEPIVRRAFSLDASVLTKQHDFRRRALAARVHGIKYLGPR